jgi:broad specificity phosphatase PhoE
LIVSHRYVIHLVRHGETASYDEDAGLTPIGRAQAAAQGRRLGSACEPGERVEFACAPTERARETATELRAAFAGASSGLDPQPVLGAVADDVCFRNLQVRVDGVELEPTQARSLLVDEPDDGPLLPGWMTEAHRFWRAHDEVGDAMQFWLSMPLLWHESPAAVVTRLITEAVVRTAAADHDGHLVVASHSGCLRALVAWASGFDPGEPDNAEEVIVIVDPDEDLVTISYRDDSWTTHIPPIR